jgi:hypothetical protein
LETGIWLLRCCGCRKTFDLEISDERTFVLDLIKETPCPRCNTKPNRDADRAGRVNWHEIVKYSLSRTSQ